MRTMRPQRLARRVSCVTSTSVAWRRRCRSNSRSITCSPGLAVEVAGGLVRQQDLRAGAQRPRHRDALLLAAGELGREMVGAVRQAHLVEQRAGRVEGIAAGRRTPGAGRRSPAPSWWAPDGTTGTRCRCWRRGSGPAHPRRGRPAHGPPPARSRRWPAPARPSPSAARSCRSRWGRRWPRIRPAPTDRLTCLRISTGPARVARVSDTSSRAMTGLTTDPPLRARACPESCKFLRHRSSHDITVHNDVAISGSDPSPPSLVFDASVRARGLTPLDGTATESPCGHCHPTQRPQTWYLAFSSAIACGWSSRCC